MKNTFTNALGLCGLTAKQAAVFFDVREDTVKGWCIGKNKVPVNVWLKLAKHWQNIEDACDFASADIEINLSNYLDLGRVEASNEEITGISSAEGRAGAMAVLITLREMMKDYEND